MKGHDGLCPSPNPQLIKKENCTYCRIIDDVKNHYQNKKTHNKEKTYDHGFTDGWDAAIDKLQQLKGL